MICENEKCVKSHNGDYGSGRFCGNSCARSYSTIKKRSEISKKVSKSLKGKTYASRLSPERRKIIAEKTKLVWLAKLVDADYDTLSYESKRKRIIIEQDGKCNHCGISEWFGKKISLEIDHINGIRDDDRRENLEAICPNCHSNTDTWRGRNKPFTNGDNKVSDAILKDALKNSINIRQALLTVGLAAKGGNYSRAKKLVNEHNIRFKNID